MKTVGIIGGIGPESTIEYYRLIVAAYREREGGPGASPVNAHAQDGRVTSYPKIIINSIDLDKFIRWANADQFDLFVTEIVGEIEKLARAGVDFGVLASNTPHRVFDEIQKESSIPLISIVECACVHAQTLGLKKVGLFGTRFTMQGRFYPDVFSRAGITVVVPEEDEQAYIHEKYMGELLTNTIIPATHQRLLSIVDAMKARHQIEGLILGGTELPLILREPEHNGVPFLDTTKIHVDRIVGELLS